MEKEISTIYSEEDFTTRVPQDYWEIVEQASTEYAEMKSSSASSQRSRSRSFSVAKTRYMDMRNVPVAETLRFVS